METNLCRKGLWATTGAVQLELPLDDEDLLGLLRASGRLRVTPDVDVLAWLIESWRRTREFEGWVRFTLHELGTDLYGFDPGGKQNRSMRTSLRRLKDLTVDLVGYDPRRDEYKATVAAADNLIDRIVSELDDVGPDATKIGALRGYTFEVQLPLWLRRQIEAGNVTYLHLPTLRALDALAKRVWLYLEAERMRPAPHGTESCWVKLGDRAYTAFGMGYKHERQARAALRRAGERIVEVDERYAEVTTKRVPGGWALSAHMVVDHERWAAHQAIRTSLDT